MDKPNDVSKNPSTESLQALLKGHPYLSLEKELKRAIRFRYKSEKGRHGGVKPIIKLNNYNGDAKNIFIKVSLYSTDEKTPHVYELDSKDCDRGIAWKKLSNEYTAKFDSLSISTKKRDEALQILMKRKDHKVSEEQIKNEFKQMQNSVKLCFEALVDKKHLLCPMIFSGPVNNIRQSENSGELRITRLSHCSGKATGNETMIILTDKISKVNEVEIWFFEKDEQGEIVWEDQALFRKSDVHHQVAITFQTPPYKENVEKKVFIQLRKNDGSNIQSEPREYMYYPDEELKMNSVKRKRYDNNYIAEPSGLSDTSMSSTSDSSDVNMGEISSHLLIIQEESLVKKGTIMNENMLIDGINSPNENMSVNEDNKKEEELDLHESNSNDAMPAPSIIEMLGEWNECDLNDDDLYRTLFPNGFISLLNIAQETVNADGPLIRGLENLSISSIKEKIDELKRIIISILISHDNNMFLKILPSLARMKYFNSNTLLHLIMEKNVNPNLFMIVLKVTPKNIINQANNLHLTALHMAVQQRCLDVVKVLLKAGADPFIKNIDDNNCLHLASKFDYPEILQEILSYRRSQSSQAMINALNKKGLAPIHLAFLNNSMKCIEILLKAQASVNIPEGKCGKTILHMAYENNSPILNYLLSQAGIDTNAKDFKGFTPKQYALSNEARLSKPDECCINILEESVSSDEGPNTCGDDNSESEDEEEELSDDEKKLCASFDQNGMWKKLGMYIMEQCELDVIEEFSEGKPTEYVLKDFKKRYQECYKKELKNILEKDKELKYVLKELCML